MTPEISAKINNYYHKSGYNPSSSELSELVREGIITQAEYEEVLAGSVYNSENTEGAGDVLSVSKNSDKAGSPWRKITHPVFSRLLLDKNSDIDMNQFLLTSLKEKWDGDRYTFTSDRDSDGNDTVTVINLSTGKPLEQITKVVGDDGYVEFMVKEFDFRGKGKSELSVAKGKILSHKEIHSDGSYIFKKYNDGDTSDLAAKTVVGADKSKTEYTYVNKELTGVYKYDSEGNFVSGNLYSGGKIYADCDEEGNLEKDYLTEELIKGLSDIYANPVALKQNISSRINGVNVDVIVDDYYEETGRFIADDILASAALSDSDKKDLLKSLYKVMDDSAGKEDDFINNLKDEILFAYLEKNDEDFKNKILSISPDNVNDIVSAFGVYSCDDDFMGKRITQLLPQMIEKSNLSDKDKEECLDHIISLLEIVANKNGIYTDDIVSDINTHKSDARKFGVDYRRLISRAGTEPNEEQVSVPNGKVDLDFVQGGIGSCWLIAGLKAINVKQGGNDILNSMLKVDNEKREVTVELPGMGKSYVISFDEINSQNHLATGDGDVRAIEIAFDRFLKEEAYEGITTMYGEGYFNDYMDLEGGDAQNVLNAILHVSERNTYDNLSKLDFNGPKDAHVLSFDDNETLIEIESDSESNSKFLDANHAYAVAGSDEEFIYLIDPREKGNKKIKVKRASFDGIEVIVDSAKLRS